MDEQKETKQEPTKESGNTQEGNKSQTTPTIDAANKAAERMEAANKKQEELINRQEAIIANQRLGGVSEAGQPSEKKEEESARDYGKRILGEQ